MFEAIRNLFLVIDTSCDKGFVIHNHAVYRREIGVFFDVFERGFNAFYESMFLNFTYYKPEITFRIGIANDLCFEMSGNL